MPIQRNKVAKHLVSCAQYHSMGFILAACLECTTYGLIFQNKFSNTQDATLGNLIMNRLTFRLTRQPMSLVNFYATLPKYGYGKDHTAFEVYTLTEQNPAFHILLLSISKYGNPFS